METKRKTLRDLNQEVLLKICKYIWELADQVAMAKTCTFITKLFVVCIWKRRRRFCVIGPTHMLACGERTLQDYVYFAKLMRTHFTKFKTINEAHCPNGLTEYLKMLKGFNLKKFPRVSKCVIKSPEVPVADADLLQLSKMLPNLRLLSLCYQLLTGEHIEKFLKLEVLQLVDVYPRPEHLRAILNQSVHLHTLDIQTADDLDVSGISSETLQVLRLDAHSAVKITTDILELSKLKVLEVRCTKSMEEDTPEELKKLHNLFDIIFDRKCDKIISIVMDNGALNLPENWDKRLHGKRVDKLHRLCLNDWTHENLFLDRQLNRGTQVKVLGLGDRPKLRPDNLMIILTKLSSLEILQLPDDQITYPVLKHIESILNHLNRTECLQICGRTRKEPTQICETHLKYWREHKLVQLVSADHESKDVAMCQRYIWGFEFKFDNKL